jgi:hypothetical protein
MERHSVHEIPSESKTIIRAATADAAVPDSARNQTQIRGPSGAQSTSDAASIGNVSANAAANMIPVRLMIAAPASRAAISAAEHKDNPQMIAAASGSSKIHARTRARSRRQKRMMRETRGEE